jgi:hypothetical protein
MEQVINLLWGRMCEFPVFDFGLLFLHTTGKYYDGRIRCYLQVSEKATLIQMDGTSDIMYFLGNP